MKKHLAAFAIALALPLAGSLATGCSSDDGGSLSGAAGGSSGDTGFGGEGGGSALTDDQYKQEAVDAMHDALLTELETMASALEALQAAAPTPADRGWDATLDAAAIAQMKTSWQQARTSYEHIEGALAPLFPDIDFSIDARYDDFMTQLAPNGDPYLFDGTGVTGMHAVERILYSDTTPATVVKFESTLPGYVAARFPSTAAEAADFKAELCQKMVADAGELISQWTPANIDVAIAFQGLISLMNEQREKVVKASGGEEESRYSQRTMADLRDNLTGSQAVYAIFEPWLRSKQSADPSLDGQSIDGVVLKGLGDLDAAYSAVSGDAIPAPPATWSAEDPSPADLMTPFGVLYSKVKAAVDPADPKSVVGELDAAAKVLGFPEFNGGQ